MSTRFQKSLLSLAAVIATLLAPHPAALAETNGPPLDLVALPRDLVRVELLEKLPDKLSWDFTSPAPSEAWTEPAFAFDTLPTRYSPKGIKVDRAAPLLLRAGARVKLPAGAHRVLLRSKYGARLWCDGRLLASTKFPKLSADGHEPVPGAPAIVAEDLRHPITGHAETVREFASDGQEHAWVLEVLFAVQGRRPEIGEATVSVSHAGGAFHLLAPTARVAYSESGWAAHQSEQRARHRDADARRRRDVAQTEEKYWQMRHARARALASGMNLKSEISNPKSPAAHLKTPEGVDAFLAPRLVAAGIKPAPLLDDLAFLRRVTLDVIGRVPTPEEIAVYEQDTAPARRTRAIERLLQHPGWADHWVGYWQDVLAENPGPLKPMLNNTGPFRWWLHEALSDNRPMDRLVTELVMMEGSTHYGGPAGFGVATENDVPLAQKAQILAKAFLGMEMQCARCHDAPYHHFKQSDLFSLAAMLRREPQAVPASSSIPTNANITLGRLVNVTLRPGEKVAPAWPLAEVMPDDMPVEILRNKDDSRERLAALLTDPRNTRFAQVLVNRVWHRYMGRGLVEPVDDWETAKPSHPELLDWLAREFVRHGYDLRHVARLILSSQAYQRAALDDGTREQKPEERHFASPARRRLTAEQLVDSLFAAVGKTMDAEEMNMDLDGRRPVKEFNNLGKPYHSWEFASLSNERDRPALAMPKAQAVVDTLTMFGWREARQNPATLRDHAPNVLQPAALANGLLANARVARLSDDSAITALALEDRPLPELLRATFQRILSRPPTETEMKAFTAHLKDGYDTRRTEPSAAAAWKKRAPIRPVSWSNHLHPDATRVKQELEREARAGDPPTDRLHANWRERMEDVVWALVNSPEFVFVP